MNRKGLRRLTKAHGAGPYLRAPASGGIIAITAKPLYLTSKATADGKGLPQRSFVGVQIDELKSYFPED